MTSHYKGRWYSSFTLAPPSQSFQYGIQWFGLDHSLVFTLSSPWEHWSQLSNYSDDVSFLFQRFVFFRVNIISPNPCVACSLICIHRSVLPPTIYISSAAAQRCLAFHSIGTLSPGAFWLALQALSPAARLGSTAIILEVAFASLLAWGPCFIHLIPTP